MKLLLEKVPSKNWILMVNELKGDENFVPYRECFFECPDSERWTVNWIVREEAKVAKANVFNQCAWKGSTGWEFWCLDEDLILNVSLKVAGLLGVELDFGVVV